MIDADVTISDYALALLCFGFTWHLTKRPFLLQKFKNLWVIFFASTALAALIGGTVHGFFPDESALEYHFLWIATLLTIGITAAATWVIAGLLISGQRQILKWAVFSGVILVIYAATIIFYTQTFAVVIYNYFPATVFLLMGSIMNYMRTRSTCFLFIIIGILISFGAAAIQLGKIAVHPVYCDHNTTYHILQALGLTAIFGGVKGLQQWKDIPV